jgi:hypothetical protein
MLMRAARFSFDSLPIQKHKLLLDAILRIRSKIPLLILVLKCHFIGYENSSNINWALL